MAKITNNQIVPFLIIVFTLVTSLVVATAYAPRKVTSSQLYDFDKDGNFETLQICNDSFELLREREVIFKSADGHEVNDFSIGDVNNDQEIEVVIGYWRYGDFVSKEVLQPTRRGPKKSYHIDIYKYSKLKQNLYLVWGSSTLPHPIVDFEIEVKNKINILKVIEGSYRDYDANKKISPIKTSNWVWDEWWFKEWDPSYI